MELGADQSFAAHLMNELKCWKSKTYTWKSAGRTIQIFYSIYKWHSHESHLFMVSTGYGSMFSIMKLDSQTKGGSMDVRAPNSHKYFVAIKTFYIFTKEQSLGIMTYVLIKIEKGLVLNSLCWHIYEFKL